MLVDAALKEGKLSGKWKLFGKTLCNELATELQGETRYELRLPPADNGESFFVPGLVSFTCPALHSANAKLKERAIKCIATHAARLTHNKRKELAAKRRRENRRKALQLPGDVPSLHPSHATALLEMRLACMLHAAAHSNTPSGYGQRIICRHGQHAAAHNNTPSGYGQRIICRHGQHAAAHSNTPSGYGQRIICRHGQHAAAHSNTPSGYGQRIICRHRQHAAAHSRTTSRYGQRIICRQHAAAHSNTTSGYGQRIICR
ncbi:hypothetical protein CYMTET_13104 [Cymbomonas tetramitiformis]|uniref:Uncharacterized protein n=1 Tax=Cymbomonas tetramitiformis TaxID=36881 RepID=A0AAE0GJD2_9CHLO|nr:hypothetical protein CYMTET_13104 [Cymbomonas tetramitiformis]